MQLLDSIQNFSGFGLNLYNPIRIWIELAWIKSSNFLDLDWINCIQIQMHLVWL